MYLPNLRFSHLAFQVTIAVFTFLLHMHLLLHITEAHAVKKPVFKYPMTMKEETANSSFLQLKCFYSEYKDNQHTMGNCFSKFVNKATNFI